jgi:pyridoxal phosphate enzyme (YggS family)
MSRREELKERLGQVQSKITRPDVTLIVVTKTYPVSDVQILHDLGVRNFGENRNEEGLEKSAAIDATWHFQGGIQSRKLRDIASWADVIHSIDNLGHLQKLDSVSERGIDIFLQLSLDGDPDRGGVIESELAQLADAALAAEHLRLVGLMCVPPVLAEPRSAFTEIAAIHRRFIADYPQATSLSAGMSGDYEIAMDCGATHIRVGSSILGSREPHE